VDGGSQDKTLSIVRDFDVIIKQTELSSRGAQFAAGINAGSSDLILMLHADVKIERESLLRLFQSCRQTRTFTWGIMGHTYDDRSLKMRIIEWSNRYRFHYLGIAFGDQGIFIRRDILDIAGGMPELPLMEDVELSLRLADYPQRIHLGNQLIVSGRRWKKKKFSGYTTQVFCFVWIYLIGKRLGITTEKISRWLYSLYYK
jgi:glycosyltransferase involved in cell wall biosynthesis